MMYTVSIEMKMFYFRRHVSFTIKVFCCIKNYFYKGIKGYILFNLEKVKTYK